MDSGFTEPIQNMNFKNWLLLEGEHSFSCVLAVLKEKQKAIQNWSRQHVPEELLHEEQGGRETESHVTVLYGLHTSKFQDVKPILQNFAPFEIVIGKVSKFPSEKYDVLKFDINGDVLHRMNESLRKLPYTSNHPKYVPHCTIAYVKKYSCEHLLGNRDFDGTQVKIEDITFSTPNDEKTHFKLKNLTETK